MTFTAPVVAHRSQETHGSTSEWEGGDDLTLYHSPDSVFRTCSTMAEALGKPEDTK